MLAHQLQVACLTRTFGYQKTRGPAFRRPVGGPQPGGAHGSSRRRIDLAASFPRRYSAGQTALGAPPQAGRLPRLRA